MELSDTLSFLQEPMVVVSLTGLFTFLALLFGYLYIRSRQPGPEKQCQQEPENSEKPAATVCPMSIGREANNAPDAPFSTVRNREEVWKKEHEITAKLDRTLDQMKGEHGKGFDPDEVKKMMGGFGGCPVFHGMPKFQDVGKGSWPPGRDDEDQGGKGEGGVDAPDSDPMDYCQHIPGHVKRTQQRVAIQKIEEDMSEDQKSKEREIQRKQLEDIFKLMGDQKEKFGFGSMEDIKGQMNLYAQ